MSEPRSIFSRRCWIDNSLRPACITIKDGKILSLEENIQPGAEDYGELVIMPGVIDAHVHLNEPGRTEWEGFDSGTRAAAAGGTTTVVDMPLNSSPVTTSASALNIKMEASIGKTHVNVGFYGGLVPGNLGEIKNLAEGGVLGIKCFLTHSGIDEFPDVGIDEVKSALQLLSAYGIPLLAHCELSGTSTSAGNKMDTYLKYMNTRPDVWETSAVEEVIAAARETGGRIHIVHVSSSQSIPLISVAKKEGLRVTAETCPHYLVFNAGDIPDGKTIYKCAPPIRSKENNEELLSALENGTLDFIASDHSPAPPELKKIGSGDMAGAWGGIAGIQFLLQASYTAIRNRSGLNKMIPWLTENPARFLNLHEKKGYLKSGFDADITVWDPEYSHVVNENEIHHRHSCSPYIGMQLYGKVVETIVNGQTVFSNNKFKSLNAGRWVLRK